MTYRTTFITNSTRNNPDNPAFPYHVKIVKNPPVVSYYYIPKVEISELEEKVRALGEIIYDGNSYLVVDVKDGIMYIHLGKDILIKNAARYIGFTTKISAERISNLLKEYIDVNTENTGELSISIMFADEYSGVDLSPTVYKAKDFIQGLNLDYFKDLMNLNLNEIAKQFLDNTANLLFIIGTPGTGKSKFIRALIYHMYKYNNPNFIIINNKELIYKAITKNPEIFFSNEHSGKQQIFILDDFDITSFTRKGSGQFVSEFVSFLLTASDGVLPQKHKFIISTNLQLNEIEESLLRPGRLFGVLELPLITKQKIKEYFGETILEQLIKKEDKSEYTIAEIIQAIQLPDPIISNRFNNNKNIGF